MTGKHSIYTLYEGHEIMFHVSTLLPFSRDNRQQVRSIFSAYTPICTILLYNDKQRGDQTPPSRGAQTFFELQHALCCVCVVYVCDALPISCVLIFDIFVLFYCLCCCYSLSNWHEIRLEGGSAATLTYTRHNIQLAWMACIYYETKCYQLMLAIVCFAILNSLLWFLILFFFSLSYHIVMVVCCRWSVSDILEMTLSTLCLSMAMQMVVILFQIASRASLHVSFFKCN